MQTICCYGLQGKTWVRDPDGNEWEVFVVLEDNPAESDPCGCGTKSLEEAEGGGKRKETAACCSPDAAETINETDTGAACCR